MPSPPVIRCPRVWFTPASLEQIRFDLTFSNRAFYQAQKRGVKTEGIPQYFYGYSETPDTLWLPVFLNWEKYGLPTPDLKVHRAPSIEAVTPHVRYRDNQRDAARALDEQLEQGKSGILSLACGKGKTVLSVAGWAAMSHAVPALAITTTKKIAAQWIGRSADDPRGPQGVRGFTDIRPEEIGFIGDGECSWEGKKFVVAIINTLALQRFPQEFYRYPGVVFFDECHRLGAPFFSTVATQFHGIRIGLSATWERADGLERLFTLHVGPVFFEDRTQAVIPDVYFVRTPVSYDLNRFRMWKGKGRRGEVNHAKVITTLSRDTDRQDFIVQHVLDARREQRKVLVLGDRKEELMQLCKRFPEGEAGVCVGSLDGRAMSEEMQDEALSRPIVLATSQLVKEGLDQPDIDTLFLLYPQSNSGFAEQAAGRILRQMENKQPPTIVVLCDEGLYLEESEGAFQTRRTTKVRPFKRICERMESNFKRLGYTIKRGV